MASLVSHTTPLDADETWTSDVATVTRATKITGSVFADEPGTVYIEQSGDGTNFDVSDNYSVDGTDGVGVELDVVSQFFRVRYVNGDVGQGTLRIFVDIRDEWGNFFSASTPSAGGAWAVFFYNTGRKAYDYVGRYDGATGQVANGAAAVHQNKSGKYASFVVASGVVTTETLLTVSEHASGTF